MEQTKKYELIRDLAVAIQKHDMQISVPTLASLFNDNKIHTSYGTEYEGGRGSYKLVSAAYKHVHNSGDSLGAEAIAASFTKEDGNYAYD